ncbi:GntR family transcriptional regulator [Nocardiopsis chromatogenes]|uniref:GntR family transcriptional regulator n=1 Tax=Nocardiopsis chromatogenes TaxID=280239 RepID=UPI00037BD34B|nr:GntR family transcriptional regulator [Nocardiopsis chromatogenes]
MSPHATPWGTYHQIADALRGRITGGDLAPGDAVPSEAAVGQEFGVARTTVRRALALLEADGLIKSVPGTGRVVCSPEEQGGGVTDTPPAQYRRIAADLREQITSGALAPGDALPSEAAIVREYGVSRGTARQALSDLEGTGLVVAIHGKGRFVRESGTAAS